MYRQDNSMKIFHVQGKGPNEKIMDGKSIHNLCGLFFSGVVNGNVGIVDDECL